MSFVVFISEQCTVFQFFDLLCMSVYIFVCYAPMSVCLFVYLSVCMYICCVLVCVLVIFYLEIIFV